MSELRDVSRTIAPDMAIFPGDPGVSMHRAKAIADGDPANVTEVTMGAHSGTHADAPVHFRDGAPAAETLPLDALIGPAWVADPGDEVPEGVTRLLIRTNEPLDADRARDLVARGVRVVGTEALSIGDPETHHVLLDARVVPLEGLVLDGVDAGGWELLCLPLKLAGSDGAPARVVLRR